jgi:hypothetical protein
LRARTVADKRGLDETTVAGIDGALRGAGLLDGMEVDAMAGLIAFTSLTPVGRREAALCPSPESVADTLAAAVVHDTWYRSSLTGPPPGS